MPTTHRLLPTAIAALTALTLLTPLAEAGRRPTTRTTTTVKYDAKTSSTADFFNRLIWLPSKWTVTGSGTDEVTFTRADGAVVKVAKVSKDKCQYQVIRQNLLKAWDSMSVSHQQMRISPLQFGSSKYKGYEWVAPSSKGTELHWCFDQDAKTAVEISAAKVTKDDETFLRSNFLLQMAVRKAR